MLFEEHDRGRGELLTDRSGLEDALRGHRYLVLEICKTLSLCHPTSPFLTTARAITGIFCRDISAEIIGLSSVCYQTASLTLQYKVPL
jgi:hypothetical protein